MNIIFLAYFTLIMYLSYLRRYKWSVLMSLAGVLHIFWFSAKSASSIHPFIPAASGIFLYILSISLIHRHQRLKEEDLENIKIVCQREEDKLRQLSTQERSLYERNKEMERSLKENETIYEYVKKLGSTLDFGEAVVVLQETLKALTEFSSARLFLIEKKNITRVYNIYSNSGGPKEMPLKKIREFEKKLINKMLKNPRSIVYEKGRVSSLGQLPPDINTLLAIPLVAEKQLVSILTLENLPLLSTNRIQLVAIQFALEVKKTQLYQKVMELSIIDSLTQLYLRRHFQKLLVNELDRCYRKAEPLSFLMIDIDWFKHYNDEYGHLVGDLILKVTASILKKKSREIDLLCRYGGDEFAVVLPRTSSKDAQRVAERLRWAVNEHLFRVAKEKFQVAVSIGVATCLPQDMRKPDISTQLTDLADSAMYQAKTQGRNRVVVSAS